MKRSLDFTACSSVCKKKCWRKLTKEETQQVNHFQSWCDFKESGRCEQDFAYKKRKDWCK